MQVCPHCFASERLGTIITKMGKEGDCPTCGAKSTVVVEAFELGDRFVPLSQLYHVAERSQDYVWDSEDEKVLFGNTGEPLEQLLQEHWPIFCDDLDSDTIDGILGEVWPDYDSMSSYVDKDLWYSSPDEDFRTLAERLMHRRRFFRPSGEEAWDQRDNPDIAEILGAFLDDFEETTEKQVWFRARKHPRKISSDAPGPYTVAEIGAPNPELVLRGGRANPAGISYLYLATDLKTAVAEVRAEPGDFVSVGRFEVPQGLRLIDLARPLGGIDPFEHADLRPEIERQALLREFGRWLSKHVSEEEHEVDYVVTQYLTEFILSKGYDGIKYGSALANGINLVVFDPAKAKFLDVTLYAARSIKIEYDIVEAKFYYRNGV